MGKQKPKAEPGNVITVNSKSTPGGNIASLMPAASRQLVTDGNQKPSVNGQNVPSQQLSLTLSSASNGMPVPSPVNTVISIPNVVKPEAEVKQEVPAAAPVRPVTHLLPQQPGRTNTLHVAAPKPQNKTTIPVTLHEGSTPTDDLLSFPVKENISPPPPSTLTSSQPQQQPLSPPIIVSSPIKVKQPETTDLMPPLLSISTPSMGLDATEPPAFAIGEEEFLESSPMLAPPKPPPPGATHLASGVGVMLSHSSSNNSLEHSKKTETAKTPISQSKKDVKLKNTNSWASLANLSTPSSAKMKKEKTGASFELFKKQAKEKEEREKALRAQEEYRKTLKEKEERERIRQEQEKLREREEEAALDQARQAHIAREQLSDFDKQKAKRDKERLKEQEKRRRMALANKIDMNAQSELMANFEEQL